MFIEKLKFVIYKAVTPGTLCVRHVCIGLKRGSNIIRHRVNVCKKSKFVIQSVTRGTVYCTVCVTHVCCVYRFEKGSKLN